MSGGEGRKVSRQDIQLVQNLIERCLQLYMSQKEVVDTLLHQAKIEPGFTELVWQKLEEENQEFFRAYHLRLVVKDQIKRFNELLERQAELMHQMHPTGITSISRSSGPQMPPSPQNSFHHSLEHVRPPVKEETLHQGIGSGLPVYNGNVIPSLQPGMQTVMDMSAHNRRMNTMDMLMSHNSDVGMVQGMNGGMIKSEVNCSGNAPSAFGAEGIGLDTRHTIGAATVSSFSNVESNSLPMPEDILHSADASVGFLGQIPRNFSLSDLTADFSNDILETYSRSPFLGEDLEDFLDRGPVDP